MKISIKYLKTERQWRSSTGYDQARFKLILVHFERTYLKMFGKTLAERQADGPKESVIESEEDLLFFTLFSLKANLTFDLLGLVGLDGSNAKRNQDVGISILKSMLCDNGYAPIRSFETVAEFEKFFHQYDTLIIDAEEQPIQRPSEEDSQKDNYSGKKKAHFENNSDNGIKWFRKQ